MVTIIYGHSNVKIGLVTGETDVVTTSRDDIIVEQLTITAHAIHRPLQFWAFRKAVWTDPHNR